MSCLVSIMKKNKIWERQMEGGREERQGEKFSFEFTINGS
jgi:hypothetical protein